MSITCQFCSLLAFLFCAVGCHTEPKVTHKLASESDIREKILGTWTGDYYDGSRLTLHFDAAGEVSIQRAGRPDVRALWRSSGSVLVVMPDKNKTPSIGDDHWVVLHIDGQELSFCQGFTTGPPLRLTRL
jgi:hypothetical protein